jgi:exosome complex exonuclease DIS3/RRP44
MSQKELTLLIQFLTRQLLHLGIVRRRWRQYCGILEPPQDAQSQHVLFSPQERTVPKVRIQTRQLDVLLGQQVVVAIDAWPVNSKHPVVCVEKRILLVMNVVASKRSLIFLWHSPFCSPPQGHYVRALGKIGDINTETEVVLLEHDVPYEPFSKAVLEYVGVFLDAPFV